VNYAQMDANVARLAMWSMARDNGNSAGASYASPDSSLSCFLTILSNHVGYPLGVTRTAN